MGGESWEPWLDKRIWITVTIQGCNTHFCSSFIASWFLIATFLLNLKMLISRGRREVLNGKQEEVQWKKKYSMRNTISNFLEFCTSTVLKLQFIPVTSADLAWSLWSKYTQSGSVNAVFYQWSFYIIHTNFKFTHVP